MNSVLHFHERLSSLVAGCCCPWKSGVILLFVALSVALDHVHISSCLTCTVELAGLLNGEEWICGHIGLAACGSTPYGMGYCFVEGGMCTSNVFGTG